MSSHEQDQLEDLPNEIDVVHPFWCTLDKLFVFLKLPSIIFAMIVNFAIILNIWYRLGYAMGLASPMLVKIFSGCEKIGAWSLLLYCVVVLGRKLMGVGGTGGGNRPRDREMRGMGQ
jgi:hypothetical protein